MTDSDKNKSTFNETLKNCFKNENIEFKKVQFFYWRDFCGLGEPESIPITGFSRGLADGKYSLMSSFVQIADIDRGGPITVSNFSAYATHIGKDWIDIVHYFKDLDYFPYTGQARQEYFVKRQKQINNKLNKALTRLSTFFNR